MSVHKKSAWYRANQVMLSLLIAASLMAGLSLFLLFRFYTTEQRGSAAFSGVGGLAGLVSVALLCVLMLNTLQWRKIARLDERQQWLVSAIRQHFSPQRDSGQLPEGVGNAPGWPWGTHHTEHLGHLASAAQRFWTLYDPADPSTAPTNDMVSEWLQQERGVSKDKARAIASILRADGLPTGPRR